MENLILEKPKLFSPGPVMVRADVRDALLHHDICHRGNEFEKLFIDIQENIKKLFNADDSYYSLVISGSGTAANEAVLSSALGDGDTVLLIKNGMFGDRLEEIIDKYKISKIVAPFDWATYPDINKVESLLRDNPEIKIVAMVFHETSTGMINPVREVGKLCEKYEKKYSIDAISAAGGEFVDVIDNHIDFVTSVGNKCVGAFPGSSFICAKESLLTKIDKDQCKNVYLSLFAHYKFAKTKHQTPNTPNVTLFWALNQALININNEGLDKRIEHYQSCAKIIRDGVKRIGLRQLIDDHLSNTVTSVFLPEGYDINNFLRAMEDRGFVLYIGKGEFSKMGMFQIANMGEINKQDCQSLLAEMEKEIVGNRIE